MSKTTKKKLRKTALKLLPAIYSDAMQTGEESGLFQHEDWRTGLCLDAFLLAEAFEKAAAYRNTEPEPQLKQLGQSVFDGLDEKWRFAVIQNNGFAIICTKLPFVAFGGSSWDWNGYSDVVGKGYDTSDWQNSLIERDDIAKELAEVDLSSELTGSELCKAMLARGDKYVLCYASDLGDKYAVENRGRINLMTHTDGDGIFSNRARWRNAVPINQRTGEPLTASEVGL